MLKSHFRYITERHSYCYLKIIKYFKIFAHETYETDENKKIRFYKIAFLSFMRVSFRVDFLSFQSPCNF